MGSSADTGAGLGSEAAREYVMLDLFAGRGGASAAMRDRGWRVVTVDLDPRFRPSIVADVRQFGWRGPRPDLIWASPPCDEFARESMPWCRTGAQPSTALVLAAKRVIDEIDPVWWVIENVRGAIPYLGRWRERCGPFFFWGWFPFLGVDIPARKEHLSSSARAARAAIPYGLSLAVCRAVEGQTPLFARRATEVER